MSSEEPSGRRIGLRAAALAALAAALFLGLTCVRLDAQGLYYDELHQATGAFTYLGSPPDYFARFPVHGIPLLNMPYSGAIKTGVYGLYLRYLHPQFGIVSWRLLGVSFVALGLAAFTWLMRTRLSLLPLLVVLGLLLTDETVLLGTRHDWGPIALALALRLAWIGIWLRSEGAARPSWRSSAALGWLVGLMLFEKLSSCVMLVALAAVLSTERRRTRAHLLAAGGGVIVGALPLIVINAASLLSESQLVSLSGTAPSAERSWLGALWSTWGYVALGAGDYVRRAILGSPPPVAVSIAEPALLVLTLVLAAAVSARRRRARSARCALIAIGCWIGIGIALYALPRRTGVHHWVLGTPFQYVAIGLALESGRRTAANAGRTARWLLPAAIGVLLAVRLVGVISLEQALWRGDSGRRWHPDLTALGRFAAAQGDDAVFVAADWGVATQIYCLSNGRPGLVHELFWSYRGPSDLLEVQRRSGATILYAVALDPPSTVRPATVARIFQDLAAAPQWRETALDPELSKLSAVTVRRFHYDPGPAAGAPSRQ